MKKSLIFAAIILVMTLAFAASASAEGNWTAQTSGTTNALYSVSFKNATNGLAVGASGTVSKTTDGGANWATPPSGVPSYIALYSVYFVDANIGWIVGQYGVIIKLTGATAATQTSGTTNALYSVHSVNASTGWAVGASGTIRATSDGGANWGAQTSGTEIGRAHV